MRNKVVFFVAVYVCVLISHEIACKWFDLLEMSHAALIPVTMAITFLATLILFKNKCDNEGLKTLPCDPKIWMKGETVFVTHSIPTEMMEIWVKKVAKRSKQQVDWSFIGGRAVVRALGDLDKVKTALIEFKPEHDELYLETLKEDYPEIYACDKFHNSPGKILI